LKGLNNIQNEKTHINKTIKERFTLQCTKKNWIWTILAENQKSYTWCECNTLSLPKYKADCGALHCKFSLSCLDNVCQDLWNLNESLQRKLFKNASNKKASIKSFFFLLYGDFFWFTCTPSLWPGKAFPSITNIMANDQRRKICSFSGMECKNVQCVRQHDHAFNYMASTCFFIAC